MWKPLRNKNKLLKRLRDISIEEALYSPEVHLEDDRFEIAEKPFTRFSFYLMAFIIFSVCAVLLARITWLTVIRGGEYKERSLSNKVHINIFPSNRGVIYDRKGNVLVNNIISDEEEEISRLLKSPKAYAHVMGFLGEPTEEDLKENDELRNYRNLGREGVEYYYDEILRGKFGKQLQEVNATGEIISEGIIEQPINGDNIKLTIDGQLQEFSYSLIEKVINERDFSGGSLIVYDVRNGEILAMTNYPSFDSNLFSSGISYEEFNNLLNDKRSPFFNRAISGKYPPGSIIKPFIAYGALMENTIDPEKKIYSSGSLEIQNPYSPENVSVFSDWKIHGWVDMRRAIAVSSNVYFYTIGGGFEDIKGMGIKKINEWLNKFGFSSLSGIDLLGEKEGILPDPDLKEKLHPDNPIWRLGDTYHASIGQGDFAITPISIARALSVLANGSHFVNPHLLKEVNDREYDGNFKNREMNMDTNNLEIVRDGMRLTVLEGTASAISTIKTEVAGKTGTAESGKKSRTHSWFMGYAPYKEPKIGIVVFLESGPRNNLVGGVFTALELFKWIEKKGGIDSVLSVDSYK